jgi:zinc ribbon protein/SH3 domain-containing protein
MFCTECGTQVDEGNKFCRNCGARIDRAAEAPLGGAAAKAVSSRAPEQIASGASHIPAQPMRTTLPRENGGRNNKLVIIAAAVAVVVLGAAGLYIGTQLFNPPVAELPLRVAEPVTKAAEAPPLPSFEDTQDLGAMAGNAVNPPLTAEPPPASVAARRGEASPDGLMPSQLKTTGQNPPAPARAARSQPSAAASRGGAPVGVYETRRATPVHEEPSASAKAVATIPAGTPVNVVSSTGDWLEVHSKRGNPPGFIRRDDATFIEKSK